jgi:N-acetylglucosaminyl-diphospho-decaprenol L-rhamnosyltransferase
MDRPILTIGLVTYNSSSTLPVCLNSIARYCPVDQTEIIAVDNDSDDNTIRILDEIPFVSKVIQNPKNAGFAAGVNQLIDARAGRHLLLLNPDCKLIGPILPKINEIFSEGPRVGIIGADVRDMRNHPREAYGVFPTYDMAMWDFSGLRKLFPRKNWSTSIQFEGNTPIEVDFPTGAFFCIRDEALTAVKSFDARFFAYFEEVDYARRLKDRDFKAMVHPSIKVQHLGGRSFVSARARYDEDFQLTCYFDSLFWYLEKHHSRQCADSVKNWTRRFASIKAFFGGSSKFGRRHQQVVRILNKLRTSSLREIYGI